jgi:hypothetical protein
MFTAAFEVGLGGELAVRPACGHIASTRRCCSPMLAILLNERASSSPPVRNLSAVSFWLGAAAFLRQLNRHDPALTFN